MRPRGRRALPTASHTPPHDITFFVSRFVVSLIVARAFAKLLVLVLLDLIDQRLITVVNIRAAVRPGELLHPCTVHTRSNCSGQVNPALFDG
eukprot:COSAG06_NODE_46883_length_343_cov_1.151639_2_plen_91_part_01